MTPGKVTQIHGGSIHIALDEGKGHRQYLMREVSFYPHNYVPQENDRVKVYGEDSGSPAISPESE